MAPSSIFTLLPLYSQLSRAALQDGPVTPTSPCTVHRVGQLGTGPELCPDIPELHCLVAGSAGAGRPCIAYQL